MTIIENDLAFTSDTEEYDPLEDLFSAQSAKPANLGDVNLRALTPFQRALLVIDGTVTKFIEAYTMEPVHIIRLSQNSRKLPADHAWLEATKDTQVVAREVLLQGGYSQRVYAYAVSLVVPERLGEAESQALEEEGGGLGRILLNGRLETFREILWYGQESSERLPPHVARLTGRNLFGRTYRIFYQRRPVMLINERFPADLYVLPDHH